MKVPLAKPFIDQETKDAVIRALESGQYILGPECKALEAEMAAFIGTKQGILLTSGTAAIQLTLEAIGVKAGDEIIVPSLTAFPTIEPLLHLGVVPKFAEIDETFTMNPKHAESLITAKTVGIIPVHLYGHPANLTELQALASKHKLFLVEDVCQAQGAQFNDKRCGSFGLTSCFSFYPSKNMTVAGDGGAVCTSDSALADKIRMLRNHGRKGRYEHEVAGYNLRFNEIQAAVGRIQLKHLADFVDKRRAIAAKYNQLLAPLADRIKLPKEASWARHGYHLYVIRTERRDELKEFLETQEIGTEIHYPIPCHLQPAVKNKIKVPALPFTEKACSEILSLPMFPTLTDAQVEHVVKQVGAFLTKATAAA